MQNLKCNILTFSSFLNVAKVFTGEEEHKQPFLNTSKQCFRLGNELNEGTSAMRPTSECNSTKSLFHTGTSLSIWGWLDNVRNYQTSVRRLCQSFRSLTETLF